MATTTDTRSSDTRAGLRERTGAASGRRLNAIDWIALVLTIIGGINWGLVGLFNIDLVAALFGDMTGISRVVYALVGLAALYEIVMAVRLGRRDADVVAA